MKKIIYFIIIVLLLSCVSEGESTNRLYRVACVGDSITYGMGIKNRAENSYPSRLSEHLGKDYEVANFGVNGATLLSNGNKPYVRTLNYKRAIKYNPKIVIIKLGTNDSKKINWKYRQNFIYDYFDLIEDFKVLESNPIIYICLPVPAFDENFGIRGNVIYNEILPKIKKIASSSNVKLINLYDPLLYKKDHFPDGVHPDEVGAKIIASVVHRNLTLNK